jgi:hypothetical protein
LPVALTIHCSWISMEEFTLLVRASMDNKLETPSTSIGRLVSCYYLLFIFHPV